MSGANQGSGSVTHRPAHLMYANPRHPSWLVLVGSVQCQGVRFVYQVRVMAMTEKRRLKRLAD